MSRISKPGAGLRAAALQRRRLEASGDVGGKLGECDGCVVLMQRTDDLHTYGQAGGGATGRRGDGGQARERGGRDPERLAPRRGAAPPLGGWGAGAKGGGRGGTPGGKLPGPRKPRNL